jgi:hypothetical protein
MSLEIAFIPTSPGDEQPRPILSFVGGKVSWSLTQAGERLRLQAAGEEPVPIATLQEFDKLTHLAITYQGAQLSAFLDGQPLSNMSVKDWLPPGKSRLVLGGIDPNARWHGRIAGLAIYHRILDPGEISKNFAGLVNE